MRRFVIAATCVALAGCGSSEVEAPEAEAENAEAQEFTLDSTAMGNIAGTYEVKLADGSVSMQTINPDGTYVDTTADGTRTGGGTWRATAEGAMCFDPEGDEGEECFSGGAPGEDFRDHGDQGLVVELVERLLRRIGVEAFDQREQFGLARIGGQAMLEAFHVRRDSRLVLAAHIDLARRVFPHKDHSQ